MSDKTNQNFQLTKNQASTSRDTILIAVFGALWGLMEATLGVTLKGLRIPMSGAMLSMVAIVIFLTGRYFVRRRGSILLMSAVAAILKLFSIGTVIAGPFMAILLEGLLAEIIVSIFGVNRFSYLFTGIFLLLYTIVHPFLSQGIIFGDNIYKIYLEMFQEFSNLIQIDSQYLWFVIIAYAGFHLLLGSIAGWTAFVLAKRVEKELIHQSQVKH